MSGPHDMSTHDSKQPGQCLGMPGPAGAYGYVCHFAINACHFLHACMHCKNYLVKMTMSEGYCSFIEQVIKEMKNTIIINQMTTIKCMVTAVSGFIEQVGSMIKNTIIIHQLPHNPSSFKEL